MGEGFCVEGGFGPFLAAHAFAFGQRFAHHAVY